MAVVGDAGFRVGTMGSGWGSPLTLRQQANQLVVEYAFFGTYDLQPRLTFTFALDGSESRNAVMIGHAESVLRSRIVARGAPMPEWMVKGIPAKDKGKDQVKKVIQP